MKPQKAANSNIVEKNGSLGNQQDQQAHQAF